jgi:hypothetical protein
MYKVKVALGTALWDRATATETVGIVPEPTSEAAS